MATKPQHLWEFYKTGDYSDTGTTGGLTLTAQGSGNSFDAGGLILNGSGWAEVAADADLYTLGNTWSIIIRYTYTADAKYAFGCSVYATSGYMLRAARTEQRFRKNNFGADNEVYGPSLAYSTPTCLILTYTGGTLLWYVNGEIASSNPTTTTTPTSSSASFVVGTYTSGGSGFSLIGTIKEIGVLKGTAWSSDDVADIYANGFEEPEVSSFSPSLSPSFSPSLSPSVSPSLSLSLSPSVSPSVVRDIADYKDPNGLMTCRVYQEAK